MTVILAGSRRKIIRVPTGPRGGKGDPGGNVMDIGLFTAASTLTIPTGTDLVQTSGHTVTGKGSARYARDATVDAAYVAANPHTSFMAADENGVMHGFNIAETAIKFAHFGAIGDGHLGTSATNDSAAMDAANAWFFGTYRPDKVFDVNGDFGYSGTFVFGNTINVTGTLARWNIVGNLHIKQLTPGTFLTVQLKSHALRLSTWTGGLSVESYEGQMSAWASRTCAVGISFEGQINCRITGQVRAYGFWWKGVQIVSPVAGVNNNDDLQIGSVNTQYNGSGLSLAGFSLTANWSGIVRTGTNRGFDQLDTLTVDVLPPAILDAQFADLIHQQFFISIPGSDTKHKIKAWDRVNNTISIFPYLNAANFAAGSGTLTYIFGGGLTFEGTDSNMVTIDHFYGSDNGVDIGINSLYGPRIGMVDSNAAGVGLLIGADPQLVCMNTVIGSYYPEGDDFQVLQATMTNATWGSIENSYALDLSKCAGLGPRDTATDKLANASLGGNGISGPFPNVNHLRLGYRGRPLEWWDEPNWNQNFTTSTFTDHAQRPRIRHRTRNTDTVSLVTVPEGFHRLFGYDGSVWSYSGSGLNNTPSGSHTFAPPTAAYASCVTTSGSPTVTMPSTAGLITGMPISGTGIPGGTTLTVVNATTITLSANATASGTVTLTVTGRVNGSFANITYSGYSSPPIFAPRFVDNYQLDWTVSMLAGTMLSNGGAVGYALGTGGTVTQATNKGTGVTLNKVTGKITMNAAALAAGGIASFVLTNSQIAAGDVLILNHVATGTFGAYGLNARCVAGSATIDVRNNSGGSLSEAIVLQYVLIRGATS